MSIQSKVNAAKQVTRKLLTEEGLMSLVEHLTELRKRLIYIAIVLFITLAGSLFFSEPIYRYLLNAEPAGGELVLHTFSFWDGIGIYMQIALVLCGCITLPFAVFQLWLFVKPALTKKEQNSALKYVPFAAIMFLIGLSFAYFVVFPLAFNFTRTVSAHLSLEETFGVVQYFDFMFSIVIPISLLFEMPLLIMFLTAIRIVNPHRLKKMRKLAYFIMAVIGVSVTPPDFISDVLVIFPLIILYEISVWMSAKIYGKQFESTDDVSEVEQDDQDEVKAKP